jgi:hypothetical protein
LLCIGYRFFLNSENRKSQFQESHAAVHGVPTETSTTYENPKDFSIQAKRHVCSFLFVPQPSTNIDLDAVGRRHTTNTAFRASALLQGVF